MKQVIVVRKDLNMSPGKMAAQVAHASLKAFKLHMKNLGKGHDNIEAIDYKENKQLLEWQNTGETKIVVGAKNHAEFDRVRINAQRADVLVAVVIDEGRTELEPQTITCMALGPAPNDVMDGITGKLQLIK